MPRQPDNILITAGQFLIGFYLLSRMVPVCINCISQTEKNIYREQKGRGKLRLEIIMQVARSNLRYGDAKMVGIVASKNSVFSSGLSALLEHCLGFTNIIELKSCDAVSERLSHNKKVRMLLLDHDIILAENANFLRFTRLEFPKLYIAVFSNSYDRGTMIAAVAAGAHGYIPADLPLDQIGRAIERIFAGEIYLPLESANAGASEIHPQSHSNHDSADVSRLISGLSVRQHQVLNLIAAGESNKSIARDLNLSPGTIKTHIAAIYRAMGVHNRVTAAAFLALASDRNGNT